MYIYISPDISNISDTLDLVLSSLADRVYKLEVNCGRITYRQTKDRFRDKRIGVMLFRRDTDIKL